MEHVYAALLLNESGAELNERNLSGVLTAAGCDAGESRTKALVAALEGVDVDGIDPGASDGSDAGVESSTDGRDDPTGAEPAVEG